MNPADLESLLRDIPDFPKPGIVFKDITPLIADGPAFAKVADLLAERGRAVGATKVAGVEARGFLFAAAAALRLGLGVIPVRKKGKLPWETVAETYDLEYGTDTIEVHRDAAGPGDRVLVIDDVIATGGTLAATCRLLKSLGAEVPEAAVVIELSFLNGAAKLDGVPVTSILKY